MLGMAAESYYFKLNAHKNQSPSSVIEPMTAMYGALLASAIVVSFVLLLAVADLRSWYVLTYVICW
jgi:hypothetical protein